MKEIEFVPTNYPSDLTDSQWAEIEEYFPKGINSTHHKRSLINANQELNKRAARAAAIRAKI